MKQKKKRSLPDSKIEEIYWQKGYKYIAGIDEAGRGPLAGPVVAAAVVFPKDFRNFYGIDDSKKLSPQQREKLYFTIIKNAVAIGISIIPEYLIDALNIYNATLLAMEYAINVLDVKPDIILVDGMNLKNTNYIYKRIIKGDTLSISIAAASIIAKVIRDNIMINYHYKFPFYGFNKNFGYPTNFHKEAIKRFGILSIHRKSFNPIKNFYDIFP